MPALQEELNGLYPVALRSVHPPGREEVQAIDILFEDRSFRPAKEVGSFEDLFAPRAVHGYRIHRTISANQITNSAVPSSLSRW